MPWMVPDASAGWSDRRTARRRSGDAGEAIVAATLRRQGWVILARQVRVGRDELDIVALDPGPPRMIVVVEVRSRRTSTFGDQGERLDEAKVRRLYRATGVLRAGGWLPPVDPGRQRWQRVRGLPWRVDFVALDHETGRQRHLRGLIPR